MATRSSRRNMYEGHSFDPERKHGPLDAHGTGNETTSSHQLFLANQEK